jgi:alpha-tubulin suppressor-like RCC1 family protein
MSGRSRRWALLAIVGLWGCEDGGSPLAPSTIGLSLTLSPVVDTIFATDSVQAGDTLRILALVKGPLGTEVPGPGIAWSSSDASVATVDAAGLVQAQGFGEAVITADMKGVRKSARVSVVQATRSVSVTPNANLIPVDDPIGPGDTLRLAAVSRDRNDVVVTGTRITWASSAPGVATVDAAGVVRARGLGTTTITATGAGVSGTATVLVRTLVKTVTVTSPVTQALVFDTVQVTAAATGQDDAALSGRTFTWQSSNPAVATVNSKGRVLLVGSGTAQITATTGFVSGSVTIGVLPRALVSVEVGRDFSCAVANLGRGYCWGNAGDDNNHLGVAADSVCSGALEPPGTPCAISPLRFGPAVTFRSVSAGGTSGCGIGTDSHVYCWGEDELGQLGSGVKGTIVSDLVARATVSGVRFKAVTVGGAHACAISTADLAYCWGADESGQLGDRRQIHSSTPIPLAPPFDTFRWSRLSAGERHTCGVTLTGEAYCWGNNETGQLGNAQPLVLLSDVPVLVSGGLQFREIAAGGNHTCGVTSAGGVVCWGRAAEGQLGNGAFGQVPLYSPVAAGGLAGIAEVSSGGSHSCARDTNGSVSCWGLNDWGQLGNGSGPGQTASPTAVAGALSFRSISAGSRHTCGVSSDGNTWCWGSNAFGALGNELQAAYRLSPQRVATPR